MVSVDVEEDIFSKENKSFKGVENLDRILNIFEKYNIKATLFVTGEVLSKYPQLIEKWSKKHEIASHGHEHVSLNDLSYDEKRKDLKKFLELYEETLNTLPNGFRAVQHAIDEMQLKLLEEYGFGYDSSILPRCMPFKKYKSFKGKAPFTPYHPSQEDCIKEGGMKILEIPITPTPILNIPLHGTWIRTLGTRIYNLLLGLKKPTFLCLVIHSWDAVEFEGKFSKKSGLKFVEQLDELLGMLNKDYTFLPGCKIKDTFD